MDPYKFLNITLNPDGSLTRTHILPSIPASNVVEDDEPVLSTDITLDSVHNTSIRLFASKTSVSTSKLPIIFYFHGGGFLFYSAATAPFHISCAALAAEVPAIVLSVDYRLAPEHRLPAAYDDAMSALNWLWSNTEHPLLRNGDVSLCFLMGSSAGGNIVFHAALRAQLHDLSPIRIAGLIFNQPYFGGEEITESEKRLENDKMVPLAANHLMWELALPKGASREHEYCNLARFEGKVKGLPASLVRGYGGDPLVDRQKELVKLLKRSGVKVVERFDEDGFHAVDLFKPVKEARKLAEIREFVCKVIAGGEGVIGRVKL